MINFDPQEIQYHLVWANYVPCSQLDAIAFRLGYRPSDWIPFYRLFVLYSVTCGGNHVVMGKLTRPQFFSIYLSHVEIKRIPIKTNVCNSHHFILWHIYCQNRTRFSTFGSQLQSKHSQYNCSADRRSPKIASCPPMAYKKKLLLAPKPLGQCVNRPEWVAWPIYPKLWRIVYWLAAQLLSIRPRGGHLDEILCWTYWAVIFLLSRFCIQTPYHDRTIAQRSYQSDLSRRR